MEKADKSSKLFFENKMKILSTSKAFSLAFSLEIRSPPEFLIFLLVTIAQDVKHENKI